MAEINPQQLATQIASYSVQQAQSRNDTQTKANKASTAGLNQLQKTLQDFKTSLSGLSGKKSVLAHAATLSQEGIATVTAGAKAQDGSYSLFVKQVATAEQQAFARLDGASVAAGDKLNIQVGSASIAIDLAAADGDHDGKLSLTELARSINQSKDSPGKVSAMVLTANGVSQLVLTSTQTGEANTLKVTGSGAGIEAALAIEPPKVLSRAQDAIVFLGEEGTGVPIKQASNTFSSIEGVTVNLTRAMKTGDTALKLTISTSNNDTAANLQTFIDGFNAAQKSLTAMLANGKNDKNSSGQRDPGGAFASDSGVRALRQKLNDMVRQSFDGARLMDFGVKTSRDGTLSLDRTKLDKALVENPAGLEKIFNSGAGTSSDLIKDTTDYLGKWLNASNGLLKMRKESASKMSTDLAAQSTKISQQYDQAYQRALKQFTQLQQLQAQMNDTSNMLNNMSFF